MKRGGFAEHRNSECRGNRYGELDRGKVTKQLILTRREKFGAYQGSHHQPEEVCAEHAAERVNTRGADVRQETEPDDLVGDRNKTGAGESPNQQICGGNRQSLVVPLFWLSFFHR